MDVEGLRRARVTSVSVSEKYLFGSTAAVKLPSAPGKVFLRYFTCLSVWLSVRQRFVSFDTCFTPLRFYYFIFPALNIFIILFIFLLVFISSRLCS